jgi:uncharacterized protein YlxW (UPF0749 family)
MCDPVSISIGTALGATGSATAVGMVGATTALGVASSAASFIGQRRMARQQARYQARASEMERQRAMQEQSAMRMRQAQEQEAANRELADVSLKSREALAKARTSAGEAGVSGSSVEMLLDDYTRQEAAYRVGIGRQRDLQDVQTGLALTDAGYRTQMRQIDINRPIDKPSFLTGALSIAQGGLSGYRTGLELTRES